ncbi:MAG: HAD family hydrolase [Planctomycetes bacterium]|nr:HAD family hydrolase [Planctomycetota bacterium]
MTLSIRQSDALRFARQSGELVEALFGMPDLVIGIERSGRPIARAFAAGSGTENVLFVREQRPVSTGTTGSARNLVRRFVPRGLRRAYKHLFFKSVIALDRAAHETTRPVSTETMDRLRSALESDRPLLVVLTDDAIDSGRTMLSLVRAIESIDPRHVVIPFALTSTANVRCAPLQLSVFADLVDYVEGDLACLDDEATRALLQEFETRHRPGGTRDFTRPDLHAYFDLDGTLVEDSFRDAMHALWPRLQVWHKGRYLLARARRKLRLSSHKTLKRTIDHWIRALSKEERARFDETLKKRITAHTRGALLAIAQSPRVRARIVTAACASYANVIQSALGIPVSCASGPDEHGKWREVGPREKALAMRAEQASKREIPAVLFGDTIIDALSAGDGIDARILPTWDRTGMITLLGCASWWRPTRPAMRGQPRLHKRRVRERDRLDR